MNRFGPPLTPDELKHMDKMAARSPAEILRDMNRIIHKGFAIKPDRMIINPVVFEIIRKREQHPMYFDANGNHKTKLVMARIEAWADRKNAGERRYKRRHKQR